jgi:hypothetical protein
MQTETSDYYFNEIACLILQCLHLQCINSNFENLNIFYYALYAAKLLSKFYLFSNWFTQRNKWTNIHVGNGLLRCDCIVPCLHIKLHDFTSLEAVILTHSFS